MRLHAQCDLDLYTNAQEALRALACISSDWVMLLGCGSAARNLVGQTEASGQGFPTNNFKGWPMDGDALPEIPLRRYESSCHPETEEL